MQLLSCEFTYLLDQARRGRGRERLLLEALAEAHQRQPHPGESMQAAVHLHDRGDRKVDQEAEVEGPDERERGTIDVVRRKFSIEEQGKVQSEEINR